MDFILREWELSDIDSVYRHAANKKIAANLRDAFPWPYLPDDALSFVKSAAEAGESRQCLRAVEIGGEAVGSIGIFLKDDVHCKSAEIGYWLGESYWGHGIMTEAIWQMCAYAFARYNIIRIYAEPFAHNTGSRRALEKAGFVLEGILKNNVYKWGEICDSCVYALLKDEAHL